MSKPRILIVEDEPNIAELIKSALEDMSYQVVSIVSTGEEAIVQTKKGNIDLVLMDIVLNSEMTGADAAEQIRAELKLPIIFLTAYLNKHLLEQAKLSEPYGYLIKPFNEKELYATIEMALYKSKMEKINLRIHNLLKCTRNITKLIDGEKNRKALIYGACKHLAETSHFYAACIVITNEQNKVEETVEVGYGNTFPKILEYFNKEVFPYSKRKPQHSEQTDEDLIVNKEDGSVFFNKLGDQESLSIKFQSNGKYSGILSLLIKDKNIDREEISLLKSIASDIIFALERIELDEKNQIAEQKLRESELKYRQVVENAVDNIVTTDINGNFIYSNQAGLKTTGYSLDELLNLRFSDLIPVESRKRFKMFFLRQYLKKLHSSYFEYSFNTKYGEKKWLGQNTTLIFEGNKVIGFHCISRDITERKQIQVALKESERRYRHLVELSPDAILVHIKGRVVFANESCIKLFGASSHEDVLNKSITEFLKPDTIDVFKANIKYKSDKDSSALLQDQQFKKLDGDTINVEVSTNPIIFNNESATQIVIRDITERKHVEEELRKSQLEVNTLLDSLPGLAFLKDKNHRYLITNQKFCDALGYTKDEVIGKTDFDLLPHHTAIKYINEDIEVLKSGKAIYTHEEQTLVDGKLLTIGTRKVPVKDNSGQVIGLIGLGVDVTERKEAEEAFKKYTNELEDLNAEKDKFFSIISHDLRSPFQGLLGLTNAIVEEYENLSVEELKLFVNNIYNSSKNLFNLIENLLQWSRIQRGKIEFIQTKIELYEAILYVLNLLNRNASNKDIHIINETLPEVFVYSDVNILHSTLQNLISNAIKFTDYGGEIKISSKEDDKYISVTVSDNGVGMHEEDVEKLFRIDTQHSTLGTAKESGTGLGLIICKELIERQGGTIKVESKLGEGSSFTFTLLTFKDDMLVD
jgi:two-component system, sensor histidine kinase and response regulator